MLSKEIIAKELIRKDFDLIAELPASQWDHNAYYHKELINHVPECKNALDIGCGAGMFSRILSKRAKNVAAIDLSPVMIEKAISLSPGISNILIQLKIFLNFHPKAENSIV